MTGSAGKRGERRLWEEITSMGNFSFGGDVPEDLAKKAGEMLNGAPKRGGIVKEKKGSSILQSIENAREFGAIRAKKEHDNLMLQSEKIKAEKYDGLSKEEREKLIAEERKRLAEDRERLEAEKREIVARGKANPSTSQAMLPEKKGRQGVYEDWLRKHKEALEDIEYGKALATDYADWAYGGYYAPEYISKGEKEDEEAKWHLANLLLDIAKDRDKNFIDSNAPFPDFMEYIIKNFGYLKDGLFKTEGEEASSESGGTGVQESESLDSVKDSPEKEGGKKRKMKTIRKHSLGGDSEDGKKE